MTLLSNKSRREAGQRATWEILFEIWWGFSIKYFMPTALSFVMFNTLRTDIQKNYGGYPLGTNFIGWTLVFVSAILFVVPIFLCTKKEPFDIDVDQPFEEMDKEYFEELQKAKQKADLDDESNEASNHKNHAAQNQTNFADNTNKSIVKINHVNQVGES